MNPRFASSQLCDLGWVASRNRDLVFRGWSVGSRQVVSGGRYLLKEKPVASCAALCEMIDSLFFSSLL